MALDFPDNTSPIIDPKDPGSPAIDIARLRLKPGDTLLVRIGFTADQTGGDPWFPSAREVDNVEKTLTKVIPKGVGILVWHPGIQVGILSQDGDLCPCCEENIIAEGDYVCADCR